MPTSAPPPSPDRSKAGTIRLVRRPVPEAYADGVELYLLDVEIDLFQSFPLSEETHLFLFAANKTGPSGIIAMVPWAVADEVITMIETV